MSIKRRELEIRSALQRVPICGCGSSDELWGLVRDILGRSLDITDTWDRQRDEERRTGAPVPLARASGFYEPMGDLPALAVEFAAHVLSHVDLLEHGSSVQCAWLTAPGKLVLLFLRKFGCDREKWPEWADTSTGSDAFALATDEWRVLMSQDHHDITAESIPDGKPRERGT